MGGEKKICCVIMLCQLTAILSGVSIMYLTVIVVLPSKRELDFKFEREPIMCTTINATDLAAGGKKVDCEWSTCGEWCLANPKAPCMQIFAMPRTRGSPVELQECEVFEEGPCSALDPDITDQLLCRKGECKDLNGIYNCSRIEENPCTDISPAYECKNGKFNNTELVCTEIKCTKRLDGIFVCENGKCNKLDNLRDYHDCERKCSNLSFDQGNTILFTSEIFYHAKCRGLNSTGNNTLNDLNDNHGWKNNDQILIMHCSFLEITDGETNITGTFTMDDCFNASLHRKSNLAGITTYLDLIAYRNSIPQDTAWFIEPEDTLRLMNNTKLLINSQGCVNTLIKECNTFFDTHAKDGLDGKIPDRYSCYFTDSMNEFVVGTYEPEATYLLLMITSILPGSLFCFSCCALFFCSKSVGVDEVGHLKVTIIKSKTKGGAPADSMIEMDL